MKFSKYLCLSFLALSLMGALFAQDSPGKVEINLDKTAFFVGETISYEVLIHYEPSVQIILDRLQEKNFQMEPFNLISLDFSQTEEESFNLLKISLKLVSYEIKQEEWRIPPFDLHYIQKGGPVDALGELEVQQWRIPAVPIAFRSARPDDSIRIREFIDTNDHLKRPFWIALLLGLSGLVLIAIPAGQAVLNRLQGEPIETQLERSEIRKESASSLRNLDWDGANKDSDVTPLYADLGKTLRKYSGKISGEKGVALTSGEIRKTLLAAGEPIEEAQQISELVDFVDTVLYSAEGKEKGKNELQKIHSQAIQLFKE